MTNIVLQREKVETGLLYTTYFKAARAIYMHNISGSKAALEERTP